jgi:hypothetical protein
MGAGVVRSRERRSMSERASTFWIVPGDDPARAAGWEHGLPPGIAEDQWPRSRASGLPLVHGFTIRVPAPHRARGADRVALSYFHPGDSESYPSEGEVTARVAAVLGGAALAQGEEGHPFWRALAAHAASRHPAVVRYRDILDHDHAIVWHTEADLAGPRCARPETPLPEGIDGAAMHLEDPVLEARPLRLAEAAPERIHIQLGRPLHPVQSTEEELYAQGFGEQVLEIETEVGGANYGDGNCQIDLANDLLDWACT